MHKHKRVGELMHSPVCWIKNIPSVFYTIKDLCQESTIIAGCLAWTAVRDVTHEQKLATVRNIIAQGGRKTRLRSLAFLNSLVCRPLHWNTVRTYVTKPQFSCHVSMVYFQNQRFEYVIKIDLEITEACEMNTVNRVLFSKLLEIYICDW